MKLRTILMMTALSAQLFTRPPLGAQTIAQDEIDLQIKSRFGENYKVYGCLMLDSLIGKRPLSLVGRNELVLDPYNTLRGAYLFAASPSNERGDATGDTAVFGLARGGQIVWNMRLNEAGYWDGIFGADDLNADGNVELMTKWSYWWEQGESVTYMWIFSWDGAQGKVLNEVDSTTRFYHRASNVASTGSFELLPSDAVAKRIRAVWKIDDEGNIVSPFPNIHVSTLPFVTYVWNGSHFVVAAPTDQVPDKQFLPANNLAVSVHAGVTKGAQSNVFDYVFSNSSTSEQSIALVNIGFQADWSSTNQPSDWFAIKNLWGAPGISWLLPPRFPGGDPLLNMVRPGQIASGFQVYSLGLPTISKFRVQGNTSGPYDSKNELKDQDYLANFMTNSLPGFTIGPGYPPSPFVLVDFLDTLGNYTTQSLALNWIKDLSTANKYLGYFGSAKANLQQNVIASAQANLQQVLQEVNSDSASNITSEAYALIRFNTEYLLSRLPAAPPPGLVTKLVNSAGTRLTTGSLQYYEGTWKAATNNDDGTFSVNTSLTSVSLRMTYEGGSQQKNNVPVGPDTVVFQTVNTQIELQNSQGAPIDTGTVQYYAGSWRSFGTTSNGVATKELLPSSYSFRLTYTYGSNAKQQDIGTNPVVVFSTTNATVQLKNSQGAFIDQGTVQYYAGAWRSFGATSNGTVSKELLPANYSFRMMYAYGSNDKQQNIGTNPTVVFSTVNAMVELRNSQGIFMDGGTVQYYAGAWRSFGTTTGGSVSKELLPADYTFRMAHEYVSVDKAQNISTNSTVGFSTVLCTIRVRNGQNEPVNGAVASYYSGAWRQIGSTVNGEITKELLPANPTFRISYGGVAQDKVQNLATSALVEFITR